jgi:hypothetical protein
MNFKLIPNQIQLYGEIFIARQRVIERKNAKWKRRFIFCALPVCLLAGCRTDKEIIQFSDDPTQPSGRPAENAVPLARKLDKRDLLEIERAIYGYLLHRHFWDDNEYSAVFLQGEDEEVDVLIKEFHNHIPPVKTSDRAELLPNRTPVDKDTGRPAMILSVDVLDPVDDTVEAVGKWYAGGAVSGFYTFSLQKVGADWVIENSR